MFYEPILRFNGAMRFAHFQSPVDASVRLVYIIFLAFVSAALLGVGSNAASPPIYVPAFWCSWILPNWVSLVLQGVFQTPWMFSCARFSAVSDLDNFEVSALEGSFGVFFSSELITFHRPISSGDSALVVGILPLSAHLAIFSGSCMSLCSLFSGILQCSWTDFFATARDVTERLVLAF